MPSEATWQPSKAERVGDSWRASRNPEHVSIRSRFCADLLIHQYEVALKLHARGVLVDVGCGRAPYFGMYRELVSQSIGVDWPNSPHAKDQVDIVCDLNVEIALPDLSADTILCTDVLEHIFQPKALWSEMVRILRPGGTLIVGVPFLYWIHEQPFDYHRYTQYALHRYAEEAGLRDIDICPVGGLSHVLIDLICKGTNRRLLGRGVASLASYLIPLLRKSAQRETKYPLAYLVVAKKRA